MMKKFPEPNQLQGVIAVASFVSGVATAAVCLFCVEPYGEIANSAISIVSELLVLCGAILGVKASYDTKLQQFRAEMHDKIRNAGTPRDGHDDLTK